jgi:pyrroline-5-carboxylate reductase
MSEATPSRLGFLGTGTIASAIVDGLSALPGHNIHACLSPRNAQVAARLKAAHPHVTVAQSNQEMIDRSDIIFLAIRPQVASEVLAGLRFRADQRIISLIATFSQADILARVHPAMTVTCAVPLPTVAMHLSPTVIFPPDPVIAALFRKLGTAIEVTNEQQFRALLSVTSGMGAFFTLLDSFMSWLATHHVERSAAHEYTSMMFLGLAKVAHERRRPFDELAQEFKTKGGLNEQFASILGREGVFKDYTDALDAVLTRIEQQSGRH